MSCPSAHSTIRTVASGFPLDSSSRLRHQCHIPLRLEADFSSSCLQCLRTARLTPRSSGLALMQLRTVSDSISSAPILAAMPMGRISSANSPSPATASTRPSMPKPKSCRKSRGCHHAPRSRNAILRHSRSRDSTTFHLFLSLFGLTASLALGGRMI